MRRTDHTEQNNKLPGILCLLMASAPSGGRDPAECLVYGPSSETQTNKHINLTCSKRLPVPLTGSKA